MRTSRYLRAPIKATNFVNLGVSQLDPRGRYDPGDLPPQGLEIAFDVAAGIPEVALLWEGLVRFDPAEDALLPASADDMREENFSAWRPHGALLLEVRGADIATTVLRDVSLLVDAPHLVRYENVLLTSAFLFRTAPRTAPVRWTASGARFEFSAPASGSSDAAILRRLLFDFLHGRAALFARHHDDDPQQDFAALSMPQIAHPDVGSRFKLTISMSALAQEALGPLWFAFDPIGEIMSGWPGYVPPMVDPLLEARMFVDARHPVHSPIPPRLLFSGAADVAWVPEHAAHPIRAACRAPLPGGAQYRRVEFRRDLGPGVEAGDDWRRPFPLHQAVFDTPALTQVVAQLPLTGRLYLPLADGVYKVSTAPRWRPAVPANYGTGIVALATRPPGAKVSTPPQATVSVDIVAGREVYDVIASSIEHDGFLVWSRLLESRGGEQFIAARRESSRRHFNLESGAVRVAHVRAGYIDYAVLYGMVVDSAARHGLAPSFVQAVFMREGVVTVFYTSPPIRFVAEGVLSGIGFLGLDWVADALGHDPALTPPRPDIGLQQLLDEGYIDRSMIDTANLTNVRRLPPIPKEPLRHHYTADVRGWRAAVEIVAAELHARLDQMLATAGRTADDYREDGLRFLSYVRYNGDLVSENWKFIAQAPAGVYLTADGAAKPWDVRRGGVVAWPASNTDSSFDGRDRVRWVALTMTAVADSLDATGAFR